MKGLIDLQMTNFEIELRGEKPCLISLHRVFMGPPGTGKTTVAKIYGKLLKELKLLSIGEVVVVTPSDFTAGYIGQTATKVKSIIDSSRGKVLFIDEAYNMNPKRSKCSEAIDVLLENIHATPGSDMAVILAGYTHEMRNLFRDCGNPGLARRFNLDEAFQFTDYSDSELRCILKYMMVSEAFTCSPSTLDFAVKTISKKRALDGFGNAGECEQILNRAKVQYSSRCISR
jgi:SpoVK/Ycf46/Vps4 family AAA+-type ATPase